MGFLLTKPQSNRRQSTMLVQRQHHPPAPSNPCQSLAGQVFANGTDVHKPLDAVRKSWHSPCHATLSPLPDAACGKNGQVRLLRHGDLRDETAAVLLGDLPIQGEAEAGVSFSSKFLPEE